MKAASAIAEILKREGVEIVFGYPVNHILEYVAHIGIRPVIVRQERVGLHMADAYSRLSRGRKLGVFAMQHGMIWVGNPIIPEQHRGVPYEQAANRLGSWSGLMAQAGHNAPSDSFVPGDIKTALMFGRHFAEVLHRTSSRIHATEEVEATP